VEIYQTEEQQVDAMKKYWQDNGNAIIAGLVIGFSAFIGYNFYKDAQLEQELSTSESYQITQELVGKDEQAYTKAGEKFIAENGESSYASLTALALAKESANHKDWPQVEKYLATAIAKATDAGIKGIATLRLARVQIQLDQIEKALVTLSSPLPESFKATVEEIKGDAYLKQDKKDLARNAYQAALNVNDQAGNSALQIKLDDLAETINLGK
jgi:predicted negative regulator of RcsB-dependent stress response